MNFSEMNDRITRIQQSLDRLIGYEGGANLLEINGYLDNVHARLTEVIFEGAEIKPAISLEEIKKMVELRFR